MSALINVIQIVFEGSSSKWQANQHWQVTCQFWSKIILIIHLKKINWTNKHKVSMEAKQHLMILNDKSCTLYNIYIFIILVFKKNLQHNESHVLITYWY